MDRSISLPLNKQNISFTCNSDIEVSAANEPLHNKNIY